MLVVVLLTIAGRAWRHQRQHRILDGQHRLTLIVEHAPTGVNRGHVAILVVLGKKKVSPRFPWPKAARSRSLLSL
jgi:hypothetical protein